MRNYTDEATALTLVLVCPEDVLADLGTVGTVDLLRRLSKEPEAASKIQKSRIINLIEGGVKYTVGKIIMGDANHE